MILCYLLSQPPKDMLSDTWCKVGKMQIKRKLRTEDSNGNSSESNRNLDSRLVENCTDLSLSLRSMSVLYLLQMDINPMSNLWPAVPVSMPWQ